MRQPETGDRARFELLFDRHRRAVLGYALRRVNEPADAADVLAETFLVAWRRLKDVPPGDDARPWLLGVARRVLANQRRGARRRNGLAERLGHELSAQVPTLTPPADGDPASVRQALDRLSAADREIVLLAGWEELEPAQIAVVLGLRPAAARSRLHRARTRLRAALDASAEPRPATPPTSTQPAKEPAR
ncbi:MAG TPA: RNA polymerase sigma factor [Conexibacter sp.]|jgi:RNA polymerase sigma-70 factor (ECF subfamily)